MKLNINDIIKNTVIFKKYPTIKQAYVYEDFAIRMNPSENACISILITYNKENMPSLYDMYYLEEELKELFKRDVSLTTQNAVDKLYNSSLINSEKKIIYSSI